MLQIGVSLHNIKDIPFEERLAEAKRCGFVCAQMAPSKVLTQYCSEDSAFTPGYTMYLKKQFAKYDIDYAVLSCYLNLANPNEAEALKITHRYMSHIRMASMLGCGMVATETGRPNEAFVFDEECHSEKALELFINRLRPVVECAEKMGVIVGIETAYPHIVCDAKRTRRVLDDIGSPNLQVLFDPVNLLHDGNVDHADDVIDEFIDLLGEDIAVMHLKDYRIVDGKRQVVNVGLGELNHAKVLRFMKERKPFIHAIMENTKDEDRVSSREFVEKLYAEL